MSLIEELYSEDLSYTEEIWQKFGFFDPNLSYLRSKGVRRAVNSGDGEPLVRMLGRTYFSDDVEAAVIEKEFISAMNRGIEAINTLVQKYLGEDAVHFLIEDSVSPDENFFQLVQLAREYWIKARTGRHGDPDSEFLASAYTVVRNFGLAYNVLRIDTDITVQDSLRHYNPVLEWFKTALGIQNPREVQEEYFSHAWETSADVDIYGSENIPFRSRLKLLGEDGKIDYGSFLMKMFLKGQFPDEMHDSSGAKFVVKDEAEKRMLVSHFRNVKIVPRLEKFKERKRGTKREDNPKSSPDYGCVKFRIRCPVRIDSIPGHPLGDLIHGKVPIEVQIMTIEDDWLERTDPKVSHGAYKRGQFLKVFPAWFPEQIYRPLLLQRGLT